MAAQTPDTRWAVFQGGQPLVKMPQNGGPKAFALLETSRIKDLLGNEPMFGQGQAPGETISSGSSVFQACRFRGPTVLFLGLKEPEGTQALPSSEFRTPQTSNDIHGAPYFSIDLARLSQTDTHEFLKSVAQGGETLTFAEPRSAAASFNMFEAAIFAVARSMIDWNTRNKVRLRHGCLRLPISSKSPVLCRLRFPHLLIMGRLETFLLFASTLGEK